MTAFQTKALSAIKAHLPGFDSFNSSEKMVQANAYVCDELKPREDLGNNHGVYVDDFLREAGGLGPGYPWCAAAQNWMAEMLSLPNPDKADASVIGWHNWAVANGRFHKEPKRGALCFYLHPDLTGHIGCVVSFDDNFVHSIEGNTSPGTEGSQRDGQGMYRRTRSRSTWQGYIYLD